MASNTELKICVFLLLVGFLSGLELDGSVFKILDGLEKYKQAEENVDNGDASDIQQGAKNLLEIRNMLLDLEKEVLPVNDVQTRQNCAVLLSKCGSFNPCCLHDSKHKGPLCCKYPDGEDSQRGNEIYQKFGLCLPASMYCNNKPFVM
ncbi:hypothetical protein CHS0354_033512 [Potamilus streckersoni]|uniref:Uncharacterized protein n=1 Tax=Potamilus streckersoni TaxID=2493646 RepID=A0AAE0SB70_9BIVA|nr:hypothetical protein CHS0354_033512 [Potamilus streckersoni]